MLPALNHDGNLPEGIHKCGIAEITSRFGGVSARRMWLIQRLNDIIATAKSTGKLERLFIWGSFISSKEAPNDLDLLLLMSNDFSMDRLPVSATIIFDYLQAKVKYNADIFWSKTSIGEKALNLMLDVYQTTRDYKRRGIIELELK